MKYDKIRKNPKQLLSLTGFTDVEFEAFLPTFKYHGEEYYSYFTLTGKIRKRISYNRKSSKIPLIEDILLFILSQTYEGHVHDKRIADEQPKSLPTGICLWQATGFLGHNPKNVMVKMPTKKPKVKELSDIQSDVASLALTT